MTVLIFLIGRLWVSRGQVLPPGEAQPVFKTCGVLDYELEMVRI